MIRVVEGRGAARRIPIAVQHWVSPSAMGQNEAECRRILETYPCDFEKISFRIPDVFTAPADDPSYRWMNCDNPFPPGTPLDAVSAIEDWDQLDGILADFPDPWYPGLIPEDAPPVGDRYRVGLWWYWLFERFWSLRGMENALCDFYENPEQVHRLFRKLTDFYKVMLRRGREELHLDAVWTSDDIGTQTAPFFSPKIFREFFKPYYQELVAYAHELGMATILWCYLRNEGFRKEGADYHASADLTGQADHLGVTIKADIVKQKLPSNNGGFRAVGFGKTSDKVYTELTSDHPIDLCRYQVANGYMGRVGLINSGGESRGASDLQEAVTTAVINKRAGGMGLISGRKAFQRPMKDGIALLHAIQDVYLDDEVTIA